jgi:hypothetical protein
MVVPVARNIEMTLEFLVDVDVLDTWGYENRRSGNRIRYFLPTLHHGDYETILVQLWIPSQRYTGTMDIARVYVSYEDVYGTQHQSGPHTLQASFVNLPYKEEILNAKMRPYSREFNDMIDILNRYIVILGQAMDVSYSKNID